MTVSELIDRLRACDPAATVFLADWNEWYLWPDSKAADQPLVTGTTANGQPFVVIGEEPANRPRHPEYPFPPPRR